MCAFLLLFVRSFLPSYIHARRLLAYIICICVYARRTCVLNQYYWCILDMQLHIPCLLNFDVILHSSTHAFMLSFTCHCTLHKMFTLSPFPFYTLSPTMCVRFAHSFSFYIHTFRSIFLSLYLCSFTRPLCHVRSFSRISFQRPTTNSTMQIKYSRGRNANIHRNDHINWLWFWGFLLLASSTDIQTYCIHTLCRPVWR